MPRITSGTNGCVLTASTVLVPLLFSTQNYHLAGAVNWWKPQSNIITINLMEKKVYFICGRPRVAVRVASCANGVYTNYAHPKQNRK